MNKLFFAPINIWAFLINLLVLVFAVFLIFSHQKDLPPQIPLWFSRVWGNERLAPPNMLWVFPIIILSFLLLNNLIAKLVFAKQKVLALVLVWAALIISLILLFPLYRILLVVV